MSTKRTIRRLALPALTIAGLTLGAVVIIGPQTDAQAQSQPEETAMQVGIYDEQALFQEYPGSDELMRHYQSIQQQMREAREAGDQQKLQQIQQGIEQKRKEVVNNFEDAVDEAMPEVASDANVKVVALRVIYTDDDVRTTNLTEPLAAAIAED